VVLAIALGLAALLLIFFTRHLTNPLGRVIKAMNAIITSGDLTSRVEVEYRDETGKLASTFNLMIGELERAYSQIKHYAFDAVLAGKKEERIRQIFQHYVPQDVINESFKNPEQLLPGKDMEMAILFSDIRNFTTISEEIGEPGVLVESLNRYFETEVDAIYKRNGWVDKYIGDAIMALWGAPVKHDDDVINSVMAGLEMLDALKKFNAEQKKNNKTEFPIGIGINYGVVTVGNIGSTHKRDYTVIGDNVNLASRMEGLTKTYKSELLITESVYKSIQRPSSPNLKGGPQLPCRLLDKVAVKGKKEGVRIFSVKRDLSAEEEKAWVYHNQGMELYFNRDFAGAAKRFREVLALLAGDFNAAALLERCENFAANPPPANWDGAEIMHTK
jgi:class 3 adenylate cyclase/HAMP domain-containing protein